ncbi:MAG: hypothetical protein V3U17_02300 [Thermoplasmata archaeon]
MAAPGDASRRDQPRTWAFGGADRPIASMVTSTRRGLAEGTGERDSLWVIVLVLAVLSFLFFGLPILIFYLFLP